MPKTHRNEICPKPSADKIQQIKAQRLATRKKWLNKLKAAKEGAQNDNRLKESDDIVRDDDGGDVCAVVNDEESDDGGESDTSSSSDSD